MAAQRSEQRLSAERLRAIYDRDYYHGVTSGYPAEGYPNGHPDWTAWLDIIRPFHGRGLLLDLGCAYGFLVEAAAAAGFRAVGVEVSRFALTQCETPASRLVESRVEQLPVGSAQAEVVCVFDVLEHLEDPLGCLSECARVLAPEGLLLGSTPDPLRFERDESTHIYERPPSYWLAALDRLGLASRFRFSNQDFNFQFLAARPGSAVWRQLSRFRQGSFSERSNFVTVQGPVEAAPRDGWLDDEPPSGSLTTGGAALYLLNPTPAPLAVNLDLRVSASPGFSTLQLRLDSAVVSEIHLTTEKTHHRLSLAELPLSAGGHHLWFELQPGGPAVEIVSLQIESEPLEADVLTLGLPFDLYQRYRLAARLADTVEAGSILDVGGVLGDEGGHLAVPADFLGEGRSVVSTDQRHCDWPLHEIAAATAQPYPDRSFDLVCSLDVLEHLPAEMRGEFLRELCRLADRWVVVAAPTNAEAVVKAERRLGESLLAGHTFLEEHGEEGLPDPDQVRAALQREGWKVVELPNGYLPHWLLAQALTQAIFSSRDFSAWRRFNHLYNRHLAASDLQEPAYRRFWVASREPIETSLQERIAALAGQPAAAPLAGLAADGEFLDLLMGSQELCRRRARALNDAQFIANARSEGLDILRGELERTPLFRLALRRLRRRGK